jgi:hypothetical protein
LFYLYQDSGGSNIWNTGVERTAVTDQKEQEIKTKTTKTIEGNNVTSSRIPDGWAGYRSEEIKVEFAYPQNWQVTEESPWIIIRDGEYVIRITSAGLGEIPQDWEEIDYYIGGYKVPIARETFGNGVYRQLLSMRGALDDQTLMIGVYAPSTSTEISDRILSSLVLLN